MNIILYSDKINEYLKYDDAEFSGIIRSSAWKTCY